MFPAVCFYKGLDMTEQILEDQPQDSKDPDFEPGIEHPPETPYLAHEIRVFRAPKSTPRGPPASTNA